MFILVLFCVPRFMNLQNVATGFVIYFIARLVGFLIAKRLLKFLEPRVNSGLLDADLMSDRNDFNLQIRMVSKDRKF